MLLGQRRLKYFQDGHTSIYTGIRCQLHYFESNTYVYKFLYSTNESKYISPDCPLHKSNRSRNYQLGWLPHRRIFLKALYDILIIIGVK